MSLRKADALIAYLATARGQTASREQLATLFWGESEQQRARQSLRQVLFALTRQFAHNDVHVLRMESQMVSLNPDAIWVDVNEFQALIAEGSPEALAKAAALYKGEFLAGLVVDALDFEEWLTASRGRFQDLAMKVFIDLLEYQHDAGDLPSAIDTANRALRIDPYREDIHRRLMSLYLTMGMRSSALTQYRSCCAVLERELGISPDEKTSKLYQDILEQGPASAPGTAEVLREAVPSPSQEAERKAWALTRGISVGRDSELGVLVRHATGITENGCHLVAATGESGIGKTHMIELFAQELSGHDVSVYATRCRWAEQSLSLSPWADLLDGRLIDDINDAPADFLGRIRRHFTHAGPSAGENDGQETYDPSAQRRFYDAVVGLLRARSKQGPLALILDDLQWADEESLRLLSYAVRHLGSAPVLFFTTICSDELERKIPLSDILRDLERDGLLSMMTLGPLSREQVMELIRQLHQVSAGKPELRPRLNQIWRLSEGNPQIVVDSLVTASSGEGGGKADKAKLPDRVFKDLERTLAPLSEMVRSLASTASVIGPRVDYALLGLAAGMKESEVVQGVENLVAAGIMAVDGDELLFTRKRIHQALYESLIPARRKALHGVVARSLAVVYKDEIESHFAALVHHHRQAGQMAEALDYELRSAEADVNRGQRTSARKLYQHVAKTVEPMAADEKSREWGITAALGLAAIAEIEQNPKLASAILKDLETKLTSTDSSRNRLAVLNALGRIRYLEGDMDAAEGYARRAFRESTRQSGVSIWSPAENLLRRLHLINGAYPRTVESLVNSQHRARKLGLHHDEAVASVALGVVYGVQGEFDRAIPEMRTAVHLAENLADECCLATCLQMLGMVQAWQGDFEPALVHFDKAIVIAKGRGDLPRLYTLYGHRGYALSVAKRFDEALDALKQATALARRLDTKDFLPLFMAWTAEVSFEMGLSDEALHGSREAFRLAAETNQPWARSVALRTLARVLAHPDVGDLSGAEKSIRSALADQQGLGLNFERARSLVVHAKVLRTRGSVRRSSEIFAEASDMFRRMQMSSDFDSARNLADVLRPTGDSPT